MCASDCVRSLIVVCIFVSVMRHVRRLCACDECVYVCVCVCRLIVFEVCCVHICVCDDAHVYGGDMCLKFNVHLFICK